MPVTKKTTVKTLTPPENQGRGTALIASACLILLSLMTGLAGTDEQLWTAAKTGDLPTLTSLVKSNGGLVSTRDGYGKLPLHYAAEAGNVEIVKFLLAHKADITGQDNRGWTALHHAVNNDHTATVELLIAHGAKMNAPNAMNWTPLHLAVFRKNEAIVIALMKAKADVFAKTSSALTPYTLAAESGRKDIAERLFSAMGTKSLEAQPAILAVVEMKPDPSRLSGSIQLSPGNSAQTLGAQ